jgi:hypothetical protein
MAILALGADASGKAAERLKNLFIIAFGLAQTQLRQVFSPPGDVLSSKEGLEVHHNKLASPFSATSIILGDYKTPLRGWRLTLDERIMGGT